MFTILHEETDKTHSMRSSMKLYFETQTCGTFDDVTDDVSDYAIYSQIYCSIVRYCSSGMCGMYCARSRDRCHALLRNAAISRLGDHSLVSQKFKVLRSR